VKNIPILLSLLLALPFVADAQQRGYPQFRSNNLSMAEVQPTWAGPLIQSDARLGQAIRFSVSNFKMPGAHPIVYGNNHGFNVIVHRRFQLDCDPPSFFRDHSSQKDGWGNAAAQFKMRLFSGNADHGNYAVSAIVYHAFGPRVQQNDMQTSYYVPSIAAGKAFGRFAVLTTIGGILPTAKVAQQGRGIEWNITAQVHSTPHTWFDVENNVLNYHGCTIDGMTQDMITPAAFYMFRRKGWEPQHASIVFDGGMQIAATHFNFYNHNLITEMRILF